MSTSITTTILYDILNPINGPRFLGIGTRCAAFTEMLNNHLNIYLLKLGVGGPNSLVTD